MLIERVPDEIAAEVLPLFRENHPIREWRQIVIGAICEPCKDAGFPNVLAHYQAIAKGASHDGKQHPAMCFEHKNGRTPSFIKNTQPQLVQSAPAPVAEPKEERLPTFDVKRAVALYDGGMTWNEVAIELGVAYARVYTKCRLLATRKPDTTWSRQPKPKEQIAAQVPEPVEAAVVLPAPAVGNIYQAVLDDLRAKRDKLDIAIRTIEGIMVA